MKNWEILFGL